MFLFENFYAQEWVQVCTAFIYVVLIVLVPIAYWKISQKLNGDAKIKFIECASEIYGVLFFLLIAPVGYLILYFLGSDSKFMLNDPMAWVCLLGAGSSIFDLFRSRYSLKIARKPSCCDQRVDMILKWQYLTKIALYLSLIPFLYGVIMVGVTNLMSPESLHSMLWFLTFLITGWSIVYAVVSKALLFISQAYASNPKLGCNES